MGSSFVKDEKLDIYMEVHKPFYYPGEIVEGCIYINAKATRNYRNLIVRLTGVEHVYWSEGSGKNRRSYSNTYQNYDNIFGITDFNGTVE